MLSATVIFLSTGMDPAGPNFDDFGNQVILDASDASFVDIIHTNAKPLRNFGKLKNNIPLYSITQCYKVQLSSRNVSTVTKLM